MVASDIHLNGSNSYIENYQPFTLTCGSDEVPSRSSANFFQDVTATFDVIYYPPTRKCYGVSQTANPTEFECTNSCSCSADLKSYTLTHIGTYSSRTVTFRCKMITDGTNIETDLIVDVARGPSSVSLNPSTTHIRINEEQHVGPITCTADCVPDCTYKWSGPEVTRDISVLQINNIQRSRNGTYTCIATNTYGSSKVDVDVVIQYGPDGIVLNPTDQTYTIEENQTVGPVTCNSFCYPVCTYHWTGPGITQTSNQLHITQIKRGQTGQFTCTASNVVSSVHKHINITVQYAATVMYFSADLYKAHENSSITFTCGADGVPIPTLALYFTDTLGSRYVLQSVRNTTSQYHIPIAKCNDTGTYLCKADNGFHSTSNISKDVIVTCPPRVRRECSSDSLIYVTSGVYTKISVCLVSNPMPRINWTAVNDNCKNNHTISFYKNSSILYTSVLETKLTDNSKMQYSLIAENSFGKTDAEKFTLELKVQNESQNGKELLATSISLSVIGLLALVCSAGLIVCWRVRMIKKKSKSDDNYTEFNTKRSTEANAYDDISQTTDIDTNRDPTISNDKSANTYEECKAYNRQEVDYYNMNQKPKVIPLTKCQNALDLIFLLDGSQSVTETNFKLVKNYTVDLISQFEVSPAMTRIGIVEYSTIVNPKIELGEYSNLQNLSAAIGEIQMSNFGTSTHKAIEYMRTMFKRSPRNNAIKVAVCITDGLSVSPNYTQIEAKRAHSENIVMFALGIGPKAFKTELQFIASKKEYVKVVSNYSVLPTNLALEICNLNHGTIGPIVTTPDNLKTDRIDDNQQNGTADSTTTTSSVINEGSVDTNRQFLPHPTDCSKFLETEDISGIVLTHERSCPFGLFYNENALTCVPPKYSTCKLDLCTTQSAFPMTNNCRGYWVCLNGDVTGVCCPAGTGYVVGFGCQTGVCDTPCPPVIGDNSQTDCSLIGVPDDQTVYLEYVTGHGNITRHCAPGTAFNQTTCDCSNSLNTQTTTTQGSSNPTRQPSCTTNLYLPFNKGQVDVTGMMDWSGMSTPLSCNNIDVTGGADGKALFGYNDCFIYIWRFASIELRNLQISFQFQALDINANNDEYQAILTNCYPSPTCDPSFALLLNKSNRSIGIKALTNSGNNGKTTFQWLPYKVGQTNTVQVDVHDSEVVFEVNGLSTTIFIDGPIQKRQSGFAFGLSGPYRSFEGYLDEIKISSC